MYLYMYHIILSSEDEVVDDDILFYVLFVSSLTFSLLSKYLSIYVYQISHLCTSDWRSTLVAVICQLPPSTVSRRCVVVSRPQLSVAIWLRPQLSVHSLPNVANITTTSIHIYVNNIQIFVALAASDDRPWASQLNINTSHKCIYDSSITMQWLVLGQSRTRSTYTAERALKLKFTAILKWVPKMPHR